MKNLRSMTLLLALVLGKNALAIPLSFSGDCKLRQNEVTKTIGSFETNSINPFVHVASFVVGNRKFAAYANIFPTTGENRIAAGIWLEEVAGTQTLKTRSNAYGVSP